MRRTERPQRKTIPINLICNAKRVLVVGGGQVGRRKIKLLLDEGASVELICPTAVEELQSLASAGHIQWTRREWRTGDAADHLLVFACTDDKHINRAILDDARSLAVPCCCADGNWADGDFTTPATAIMGDAIIAVSTNGQSCKASRDIKNEIAAMLEERKNAELVVLGTSDALLPSRKRAPFHLPAERRAAIARLIPHIRGVREFLILNTCNRIELIAVITPNDVTTELLTRLIGFDELSNDEFFLLKGYEAFRHLVRVTSGLESSLLGEFHIVSQVKEALEEAATNKWSGPAIAFLGAEIMRVSKLVRHAVDGMLAVAEIDQVAVRYLAKHGGMDANTHVVVIGSGMVGRGAVESLSQSTTHITWLYHRNRPEPIGTVTIRQLDELREVLRTADIVIAAVDSAQPVVTRNDAEVMAGRDVLFIDLGVPRNIDPYFDDYGRGITVADLDDLKLWHRVKTGKLNEVLAKADAVIQSETKAEYFA